MKRERWAWWKTESGPRSFYLPMGLFGAALLAVLLWVLLSPEAAGVGPIRFDRAEQCVEAPEIVSYDRAGVAIALRRPPEVAPGCWQAVDLPTHRGATAATFRTPTQALGRISFRLRYVVPGDWTPGEALMVYVPRVMGAAWQVRMNGAALVDNLDSWRMTWNRPLEARLAPERFRPGQTIEIAIAVVYVDAMGFAMSRPTVGPAGSVGRTLTMRQFLQSTMPQAASAVMLLLGAFFFSIRLARRVDAEYLLLALSSIGWSVCNLQYALPRGENPQLDAWYVALVQGVPIPWLNWLVFLFAARLASRRVRWLDWLLPPYVVGISVVTLPLWSPNRDVILLVATVYTVVGVCSIAVICWLAVVSRSMELRVMSTVLFLAAFAGASDLALTAHLVNPERLYLVPYCGMLLFASFLYAVRRRYVGAIDRYEQLSADLARRLAQREAELTENHLRLREFEHAQTLAAERQRLMRDMHDGLGSALTSSLAVAERGEAQPAALAGMLRECIDDLRAVIDSLEPMDNDLVALLATLRFRIGQRLDAAGIQLDWSMQDLPPLEWLGPTGALQVLRIVQEALANVIKHAQARRVQLTASHVGEQIELCIRDDGTGFDTSAPPPGRGLRLLAKRAVELGGILSIESAIGSGSTLRLRLDVARRAAPRTEDSRSAVGEAECRTRK